MSRLNLGCGRPPGSHAPAVISCGGARLYSPWVRRGNGVHDDGPGTGAPLTDCCDLMWSKYRGWSTCLHFLPLNQNQTKVWAWFNLRSQNSNKCFIIVFHADMSHFASNSQEERQTDTVAKLWYYNITWHTGVQMDSFFPRAKLMYLSVKIPLKLVPFRFPFKLAGTSVSDSLFSLHFLFFYFQNESRTFL